MPRLRPLLSLFLLLAVAVPAAAQTISGVVTSDNGTPLPQMVVQAYLPNGSFAFVTTNSSGRYNLSLNPGSYRVLAFDPLGNFATGFNTDAPSFEESPQTVLTGGTDSVTVNLVLHLGGKVRGSVAPTTTANNLVTVAAYNISGTRRGFTIADPTTGAYSLVLPPGTYKIAAYDNQQTFAPYFFNQKLTFAAADPVTVTAQQTTDNIGFFLQIGARLSGIVTDSSNVPIANAVVLAYNSAGVQITFALTANDGTFNMTLPAGTYRFVAVDPSFVYAAGFLKGANSYDNSPPIQISGGQTRNDLAFRLERGGTVSGSAIDATTGAPIRNITVAAYNKDGTQRTFVSTDANGNYVLLLPSGDFRIAAFDTALVYATQFYPQSSSFERSAATAPIPGQGVTLQPFTLVKGGHVRGKVTDESLTAVAGAVVSAYDISDELITSATTGQDGSYRIVVPPGSYRLIAYDPLLRYAPAFAGAAPAFQAIDPITVTTNVEAQQPFTLRRGTLLNGAVVDRAHAPVSDMVISALDLNANAIANAISGTDGTFHLALVPGQYKFLAYDPNGRYNTVYMGGSSFQTATTVTVAATGAPVITVTVTVPAKRRAVGR